MHELAWLIAAIFLPLFPLAMGFNVLFQKARSIWLKIMMVLVWPLPGVFIVQSLALSVPDWVIYWALFTAVLYGFRAVVIKDFGIWTGFLATSAWALGWLALKYGIRTDELLMHVLSFSLPLALLLLLVDELEKRYQSAYVSVVSGLAQAQPRLAILFVFTLLAVIGSPLFPSFFTMLDALTHSVTVFPAVALGLGLVWLMWSWSGISILQELLIGAKPQMQQRDISQGGMLVYGASLMALVVGGLYLSRILL